MIVVEKKILQFYRNQYMLYTALTGHYNGGTKATKQELDLIWERLSHSTVFLFQNGEHSIHDFYRRVTENRIKINMVGKSRGKRCIFVDRGVVYGKKETRTGSAEWTKVLRRFLSAYEIYDENSLLAARGD